MNESFLVFAWTLGGLIAFGLIGAIFGGVAGWLHWRSGHAGGTVLAHKIAGALSHLTEEGMSRTQRGTVIGCVDGALFLGSFGLLVGLLAGLRGDAPREWLLPLFEITLLLMGLAFSFGMLALGIVRLGLRAVVPLSVGGMSGAVLAGRWAGVAHVAPGAVAGLALGVLAALFLQRLSA